MYLQKNEQVLYSLRDLYRQFGYRQYKVTRFEEYDLYVRNKNFLVSKQMLTFTILKMSIAPQTISTAFRKSPKPVWNASVPWTITPPAR